MRVLLIGFPVEHSVSPTFQNAAFAHRGLAYRYLPHPVERFDPPALRAALLAPDVLGANVTVPHKRSVRACLDEQTSLAEQVGAVNTIYRHPTDEGRLVGHNTDVGGLSADLDRLGVPASLAKAVVLGAGGAARAAVVALAQRAQAVAVINRNLARAESLALEVGSRLASGQSPRLAAFPLGGECADAIDGAELVVDATSVGLGLGREAPAYAEAVRLWASLPWSRLAPTAIFYDLKYGPPSPLLTVARRLGRPAHSGLGMLVMQGALSFRCWTGLEPPVEVMARAVGLKLEPAQLATHE